MEQRPYFPRLFKRNRAIIFTRCACGERGEQRIGHRAGSSLGDPGIFKARETLKLLRKLRNK
jgi:hypothetical protein